MKQVLLALSALHEHSKDSTDEIERFSVLNPIPEPIIHRDVKADNVLVHAIDAIRGPIVKLSDFGFAKAIS